MAEYHYDPVHVRAALWNITSDLVEVLEQHEVEVDPRIFMALQTICTTAVAKLDDTILRDREVKQMNLMFDVEKETEDGVPNQPA